MTKNRISERTSIKNDAMTMSTLTMRIVVSLISSFGIFRKSGIARIEGMATVTKSAKCRIVFSDMSPKTSKIIISVRSTFLLRKNVRATKKIEKIAICPLSRWKLGASHSRITCWAYWSRENTADCFKMLYVNGVARVTSIDEIVTIKSVKISCFCRVTVCWKGDCFSKTEKTNFNVIFNSSAPRIVARKINPDKNPGCRFAQMSITAGRANISFLLFCKNALAIQ